MCLLIFAPASAKDFSLDSRELCAADGTFSPYALSVPSDVTVGSLALGSALAGLCLLKLTDFPSPSQFDYDLSKENALDAYFARPYSKGLDLTADIVRATSLVLPVALFGTEALMGNLPGKELFTVGTMYAEALVLSWGVKAICKSTVHRLRPYMYFDEKDPKAYNDNDFQQSWPSGHSTSSFMVAAFVSTVFCKYYPESVWRLPVIAVSYALATGTAALRMASGNHFFTDVLSGAVIGTAFGILVPLVHGFSGNSLSYKESGKEKMSFSVVPGAVNFRINL